MSREDLDIAFALVIRKRRYEKQFGVKLSSSEYVRRLLASNKAEDAGEVAVGSEMSQMVNMSQLENTSVVGMSQMADMSQIEQQLVESNMDSINLNFTQDSVSQSINLAANETNTESIGFSQTPCLVNKSPSAEISCTQQSVERTQATCESSPCEINQTQLSPSRPSSSPVTDSQVECKVDKEPLDTDKELTNIRKMLLLLTKKRTLPYMLLRKNLLSILNLYNKLSQSERTELTVINQLSSSFLRLFPKLFECPTLDNNKLHELFKVGINCYVLNFKFFTKADRKQYNILFQFIYDLIFVNVKIKSFGKESYFLWIQNHKVKNQLTTASNRTHVQILLYYLIQLLFLLIDSKKEELRLHNMFYFQNQLRKLLAFLILNGNAELLRVFRHSRSNIFKA